jgi:aminoglycoside phosphotransferase (APT) family kinase protein
MEDLGWMCVRSWRFGKGLLPVGGFGTREQLFEGYASEGGIVDAGRVHWWEVMGSLKWGVICETMLQAWLSGRERDVEKAVIGRRASEAESDLLALLAPEGVY